jgi:predicted metalloprotease
MQWTPGGSSEDIEDRRDESGGGGGGFGFGGFHLGIGGFIIVGLLSLIFHQNLFTLFSGGPTAPTHSQPNRALDQQEQPELEFVKFVLNDVQGTWTETLPRETNVSYRHAKLVLFRNAYPSACGTAQSAIGPFYCPGDEKVYLDLGFFDELKERFGAPGEFAQAYVIAHEIGHHVQKLLGIETEIRHLQQQNPSRARPFSVRLELQADCLAGVWGNSTHQRNHVQDSEVAQGLQAAAAVGDDRLQRMATGHVSPETFTHGSSSQRVHWFRQGLESGDLKVCEALTRF